MAVTVAPTNTAIKIGNYRAVNPGALLTHVGLVSVAPGSVAQPGITSGFFDVWYDLAANKLLIDTTSTQP